MGQAISSGHRLRAWVVWVRVFAWQCPHVLLLLLQLLHSALQASWGGSGHTPMHHMWRPQGCVYPCGAVPADVSCCSTCMLLMLVVFDASCITDCLAWQFRLAVP